MKKTMAIPVVAAVAVGLAAAFAAANAPAELDQASIRILVACSGVGAAFTYGAAWITAFKSGNSQSPAAIIVLVLAVITFLGLVLFGSGFVTDPVAVAFPIVFTLVSGYGFIKAFSQ